MSVVKHKAFVILIYAGFIMSCAGGGTTAGSSLGAGADSPAGPPQRTVALETALADVAAYQPPAHGDPALYTKLADELAAVLHELYSPGATLSKDRQLSAFTPEQWDQAWCAQCASLPSGMTTLHWRGRHLGDYNMDGIVTANDLTPLGFNYDVTVEKNADGLPVANGNNEWASVVDGSDDGLVGISDITQIGQNYNSRLVGYRVYLGTTPDGAAFTWDTAFQPNADTPSLEYTVAFHADRDPGAVQIYTYQFERPVLNPGERLYARIVAWDGDTEGDPVDLPVLDGPHAMFNCDTCHTMLDLGFRGTDGTCNTCHATPPEDHQASWADTSTMHRACMSCHAEHIFTIDPPQSACGTCHSGIVTATAATRMPACLDCHEASHLPLGEPAEADCKACHTEPPGVAGGDWADAPGLHGECDVCHESHVLVVDPLVETCDDCHSTLIAGGHAGGSTDCLSCHVSAHVPSTTLTGIACSECHPNPPEDLSAEWTDAPGNHGQCFMCHIGEEHGVKPVPPESICADCHADTIAGSHAALSSVCLECHTYPHLPEFNVGDASCVSCHPTPPEDPLAEWDHAPGQHNQCELCHETTSHGQKPIPPESICTDCHSLLIAGGHGGGSTDCLGCHSYPHLPDEADLHDTHSSDSVHCGSCHSMHGGMDPDRAKCMECHADKGDHHPETECIVCHS